jgi:hypothetical protein
VRAEARDGAPARPAGRSDRLPSDARTLPGDLRRLDVERRIEELRQAGVDAQATVLEITAIDAEIPRLETEPRSSGRD